MKWGRRLKLLRVKKGMSQTELAIKSGLSRAHISRIENDSFKDIKQATFSSIANALDMSIDELNDALREGGAMGLPFSSNYVELLASLLQGSAKYDVSIGITLKPKENPLNRNLN